MEMDIPDQVKKIDEQAFVDALCSTINIGSGVSYIHPDAFLRTGLRTNITVNTSNTHYTSQDANGNECKCIMNLNADDPTANRAKLVLGCAGTSILDSIKILSHGCFSYLDFNNNTLTIPSTIKEIETWAIYETTNLVSITLPYAVQIIDEQAFGYNDDLETFILDGDLSIQDWKEGWSNSAFHSVLHNKTFKTRNSEAAKATILNHWKLFSDWTFVDLE